MTPLKGQRDEDQWTWRAQVPLGYLDFCVLDSRCSQAHWVVNPTLQDAPGCIQWPQNILYIHPTLSWCTRECLQRDLPLFQKHLDFLNTGRSSRLHYRNMAPVRLPNIWKFWKNIKAKPWKKVGKKQKRHAWRSQENGRTEELSPAGQACCWWHSRNLSLGILGLWSLLIHR